MVVPGPEAVENPCRQETHIRDRPNQSLRLRHKRDKKSPVQSSPVQSSPLGECSGWVAASLPPSADGIHGKSSLGPQWVIWLAANISPLKDISQAAHVNHGDVPLSNSTHATGVKQELQYVGLNVITPYLGVRLRRVVVTFQTTFFPLFLYCLHYT